MGRGSTHWKQAFFTSAISLYESEVWQPLADVYRTRSGWLIKYDLAGILPKDVSLTIDGSRLILRGIRRDNCMEAECCHYQMEIAYSHFERTIELPDNLDRAQINTEYRDGMLLVRIEKEALR